MKINKIIPILFFTIILVSNIMAQDLKPYILAATSDAPISEISDAVKTNLTAEGLDIIGEYSPANDINRKVFVVTSDDLKSAVKTIGNLTGFATALRIGLTDENGTINISYTNPVYWGNAYYQDKYNDVQSYYNSVTEKISTALFKIGESINLPFGSEKGLTVKSLRKYRYMFGMEKFDDVVKLNEFESFEEAVEMVDSKLAGSDDLVFSVEFPDENLKLYGIAIGGEKGEEHFLPIIDITAPQHTAFLPYELLVVDKKAVMLHGRYRIALSFPDLTMMTFSKIMSTPGDIKDALKAFTE